MLTNASESNRGGARAYLSERHADGTMPGIAEALAVEPVATRGQGAAAEAEARRILADVEPADHHKAGSQRRHSLRGWSAPGSFHDCARQAAIESIGALLPVLEEGAVDAFAYLITDERIEPDTVAFAFYRGLVSRNLATLAGEGR